MAYKIFEYDPMLKNFEYDINLRMEKFTQKKNELTENRKNLSDFANGHEYFGFHKTEDGWVYREWAPAASEVYLTGDMVNWHWLDLKLTELGNGVFEIKLPKDMLYDGCKVKTIIRHKGKLLERIPLYIKRVVQDKNTALWTGVITDEEKYDWKNDSFIPDKKNLFIYECHIGMAQEKADIGSYKEFIENTLPRIKALGYNTIQIMAIMEHPYYGSFGYQVSSFFAACSRYGTPNELKELIDAAHEMGIAVLLDLVHSHAVKNTAEGLNEFDGTEYQFFHEGAKGDHPAWGTKLFNYGKNEVIHFLLSNIKFWLTEYHFDGFRFDGVTSMLYFDHGLGTSFTDYGKYFSMNTDTDAVTYLQLANALIRSINKNAITIAEDMSAMPGMCLPIKDGGVGFDFRLAMGLPDLWVKLVKTTPDENWSVGHIWYELTNRRPKEKYIAYVESHDQALVGDQTLMFRMSGSDMYYCMNKDNQNSSIDRAIALHKLTRMVTMTLGGEGYLNFMGNEFGHPEWIDFPREGNAWSYEYCRRQWHLADDENLKYRYLLNFDKAMVATAKESNLLNKNAKCIFIDENKQIMVYKRGHLIFAVNFNPTESYEGYYINVDTASKYRTILSTDDSEFGGWDRVSKETVYTAKKSPSGENQIQIYLPARCGIAIEKIK